MAVYSVTQKYLLDNYAVLQSLTPTEIAVGQSITVASVDATFNGTYTVRALPQYLYIGIDTEGDLLYDINVPIANQVLYAKIGDELRGSDPCACLGVGNASRRCGALDIACGLSKEHLISNWYLNVIKQIALSVYTDVQILGQCANSVSAVKRCIY